eukprot:3403586-Amphidinium_carterae.1
MSFARVITRGAMVCLHAQRVCLMGRHCLCKLQGLTDRRAMGGTHSANWASLANWNTDARVGNLLQVLLSSYCHCVGWQAKDASNIRYMRNPHLPPADAETNLDSDRSQIKKSANSRIL